VFSQQTTLDKSIQTITDGKKASVGISVTGIDFDFQYANDKAQTPLPLMSVFKFPIACAVYDLVDQGKLKIDQKIFVKKSDLLENTYSPIQKKYPHGNVYLSLREIIRYTVAESDNNGCDLLLRLIGGPEKVQKFLNSKRIKDIQILFNEEQMHQDPKLMYKNVATTNAMNEIWKKFYQNQLISKKSTKDLMNILLSTSTGKNKLAEQLPKGSIAHKTGSSGKPFGDLTIAENDTGLVTLPNGKHYAITVFVSESTESDVENCKMISDISKTVYYYLSSEKP